MNKLKEINDRWKRVKTIGEKKDTAFKNKDMRVIGDRHKRKWREKDKTMKEKKRSVREKLGQFKENLKGNNSKTSEVESRQCVCMLPISGSWPFLSPCLTTDEIAVFKRFPSCIVCHLLVDSCSILTDRHL